MLGTGFPDWVLYACGPIDGIKGRGKAMMNRVPKLEVLHHPTRFTGLTRWIVKVLTDGSLCSQLELHGPLSCVRRLICSIVIYVTTQIDGDPTEEQVDLAVDMLKLLADSTRLRIVWALLHSEHSVNELAAHLGANPAGVSQHLAKLRLSRLVTVRREGNKAFYAVENVHVRRLTEEALFHTDHVVGGQVTHEDVYEPQPTERRRQA